MKKPTNREQRRRALQASKQAEKRRGVTGRHIDNIIVDAVEVGRGMHRVAESFSHIVTTLADRLSLYEQHALRAPIGPGSVIILGDRSTATVESIDDAGQARLSSSKA